MQGTSSANQSAASLWTGRVLSILVTLFLVFDGGFQVIGQFVAPDALKQMMEPAGISVSLAPLLGSAILVSIILYAIPATSVLGAIMVTGYLGGAIATDLRVSGPGAPGQIISVILGIFLWGGLYLRSPALRNMLPFVR